MLYNPDWKQPAQVMLDAADLIRKHGLAKHLRHNELGGYCIHGAVSMALHGEPYKGNAQPVMRSIVAYMKSMGLDPLAGDRSYAGSTDEQINWIAAPWNNQPERTAEEVIAVLEGAAAHAV